MATVLYHLGRVSFRWRWFVTLLWVAVLGAAGFAASKAPAAADEGFTMPGIESQKGHGADLLGVESTGPIMSMMPIFLVGIVFGLAMDYEVFLVSRVRESYVHGDVAKTAIVSGFKHSARVVVAAALIMTAVFSGFIGAGESMIKMIGFGLAIAVLFDAFVVRMAIVPAVLSLLGDKAWYLPRWLDRLLPDIDVEGEKLSREVPAPTGPAAEPDDRPLAEPVPVR